MNPNIFSILNASTTVKAIFGSNPLRVYPWGMAPENCEKPYATYLVFSGSPANTLGENPTVDNLGTQIDVWAENGSAAVSGAEAIRDALQSTGYMLSFAFEPPDEDTNLYRQRMDFNFFEAR